MMCEINQYNSKSKLDNHFLKWFSEYPLDKESRPNWDEYFLMLAFMASRRSSCLRSKVGAIIVKDRAVISTGYNGAPYPQYSCLELGKCYRDNNDILSGTQLERCRASGAHAESNAIAKAAMLGHSTQGATLYLYGHSRICNMCRGIIANAFISRVVHLLEDGIIEQISVFDDWKENPLDKEKK